MLQHDIRRLLRQRGEMTLNELCRELNCWSQADRSDVRSAVDSARCAQLGEAGVIGSTILFPQNVGLPGGDGVEKSVARHGIPYMSSDTHR